MRFICSLIVVEDIAASRRFYEELLGQKVRYDFGANVEFECGFSIHAKAHFAGLIGAGPDAVMEKSRNFELYFEEDAIEAFAEKIGRNESIELVHGLLEQPWGQRVVRFFDPDGHIVEVGESMESAVKRFLKGGLSAEETARRTSMPLEYVLKTMKTV
jgi:predicted enzyme related to lactoylglutathione lyase